MKALRQGDWVLLDEINLATAETLECLSGLLETSSGSVVLLERGSVSRDLTLLHIEATISESVNKDKGKGLFRAEI